MRELDSRLFGRFDSRGPLRLERSSLKGTKPFQNLPASENFLCFKRAFKESEEHQLGSVYAAFDAATSTAVVFRGYRD